MCIYIHSNGAVFTPWSVSKRMHESWKFHSTHLHSFDETRVLCFFSPPIFPKNWRNYPLVVPNVDGCKNTPCSIENTSTQSKVHFPLPSKRLGGNSRKFRPTTKKKLWNLCLQKDIVYGPSFETPQGSWFLGPICNPGELRKGVPFNRGRIVPIQQRNCISSETYNPLWQSHDNP